MNETLLGLLAAALVIAVPYATRYVLEALQSVSAFLERQEPIVKQIGALLIATVLRLIVGWTGLPLPDTLEGLTSEVVQGFFLGLVAIGQHKYAKEKVTAVLALFAFGLLGIQACTPAKAEAPKLTARVEMVSDTTVRVISNWGYKTVPNGGYPDSTRLKVGLGSAPTASSPSKFVIWPKTVDTSLVTVAAYGTVLGYSCVVPHRRSTWGAQTCTNWQFVRPDVTVPPFDTLGGQVAMIGVRPAGMQVDPDVNGTCAAYQRTNPTASVWVTINVRAVPQCTGPNGAPTVAQFCAFYMLRDSTTGITDNSKNQAYCLTQYDSWKREVGV